MALISDAAKANIDILADDLKYFTLNPKHKRKAGYSMGDDDVIATEEDARAVVYRISKAVVVLNKALSKVTDKFKLS